MTVVVRGAAERRSRRRAEATDAVPQPPWGLVRNPHSPIDVLNEEQVERIEDTAFRVLENLGLEFWNDEAIGILERHGARIVDRASGLVTFDRGLIKEMVAKAPAKFTLHAPDPTRDLVIGENYINFHPVGGAPNVSDLDRGRRPGSYADLCDLMRVMHSLNCVHFTGSAPEPQDLPTQTRHLDVHRAQSTLSNRVFAVRGIGRQRVRDGMAIAALAGGTTREALLQRPSTFAIVNTNSPRRVDRELLSGLMELAEHGQAVCVTPFTLAGAMAPVSIAGALVQQHAEALAVIAFTQMVRPGTPVIYGGFTSNVDMRSGAPMFGTPEYIRATLIGGQFARRYKLPYRASNVCASNAVDAQSTYESAMSLWACVMSHANIVHHGLGWLEGGLVANFEKAVIDAEMIETMRAWLAPLSMTDEELGFDAIAEVAPGGHFFGAAHTMARFETAFHRTIVSDVRNFETWAEAGGHSATDRANVIWKRLLANYQPPDLAPERLEAIDAFIAKRRAEIDRDGLGVA